MRLLVYTDYVYVRRPDGVYASRAFALFLAALAPCVEQLTIAGRVRPAGAGGRYRLPDEIAFVGLPYYERLDRPLAAAPAMAASLRVFATAVAAADTVWLLGPSPVALAFATLARARGRRVVLGVRQDLPRYVRHRHPGRRWLLLGAGALELAWRAAALRLPVVAVGPELARAYRRSRRRHELTVSLVRHAELAGARPRPIDPTSELSILSVGRLEAEKNPLLLADVLAALHARGLCWRLVVCGEGPLAQALADRLADLGVAGHAELRGYVAIDGELPALYRRCDLFLHVSWTEGYPQVLVEALAAGLPVVATAVGGVPQAAGGAALLVPPGDAEAAADALARLAADAVLRRRLTLAGTALAREHTIEAETSRLAAFLRAA